MTPQEVRQTFDYCPETGILRWKMSGRKKQAGAQAGSLSNGYIFIKHHGERLSAHRLAYCHFYGKWPAEMIDHIDGRRSNNRISNLRDASNAVNQHNQVGLRIDNTSGFVGVSWCDRIKRFRVGIKLGGKQIHIGCFSSLEDAALARKSAELQFHPTKPRSKT